MKQRSGVALSPASRYTARGKTRSLLDTITPVEEEMIVALLIRNAEVYRPLSNSAEGSSRNNCFKDASSPSSLSDV